MKRLVLTEDNVQNYVIVEDYDRNISWVQDYDLSEKEIEEIRTQFYNCELDTKDIEVVEGATTCTDRCRDFGFKVLNNIDGYYHVVEVEDNGGCEEIGVFSDLNDAIHEAQGRWCYLENEKGISIEVRKYTDEEEQSDYESFEWQDRKWYAVLSDDEDTDWGTGSYDKNEAEEMLREYPEGMLAEIEETLYYEGEKAKWEKLCVWETPCSEIWG